MNTQLVIAYNVGRSGGKLMWYFNPDHPDAHADAVAEYLRGVAARTGKPGLPVQTDDWLCPNCKRVSPVDWSGCPWCPPGIRPRCEAPSRAVPSLSGEFPGLGKWELNDTGLRLGDKWAVPMVRIVGMDRYMLEIFDGPCAYSRGTEITIPNWHTLLSALPPREVVGDYVTGPQGVKFQVETQLIGMFIYADGYPLVWISEVLIALAINGPLFDNNKPASQQLLPLRGEA